MENEVYIKMYRGTFTSGLVRDLGANRWAVLCAIASYMNEDGEACPTQKQLAHDLGLSLKTTLGHIKYLAQYRFNGQSVLEREYKKSPNNAFVYSFYKVLPTAQLTIFNQKPSGIGDDHMQKVHTNNTAYINNNNIFNKDITNDINENIETNANTETIAFETPKDVITYFCTKYLEQYEISYSVNWGRDASLVKNKLMKHFMPDEIKSIIDTVFAEYDRRWKTQKYLRPTIGALTTWMAREAYAIYRQNDIPEVPEHGGYDFEVIVVASIRWVSSLSHATNLSPGSSENFLAAWFCSSSNA